MHVTRLQPRIVPSPLKPMISEVSTGNPDGLEIVNTDLVVRSIAGWRVRWDDGNSDVISAPLGIQDLQPAERVVVREAAVPFSETPAGVRVLPVLPSVATSGNALCVQLLDANGEIVDEVRLASAQGAAPHTPQTGHFRGLALRLPSGPGIIERCHGRDGNSGEDWTSQAQTSMGLENRTSGPRGTDPLPRSTVTIEEFWDSPDQVELRNREGSAIDLQGYFLSHESGTGAATVLFPFGASLPVPSEGRVVLGEAPVAPPLPPQVPYVPLDGNLVTGPSAWCLNLHDDHGRLVDAVRVSWGNGRQGHVPRHIADGPGVFEGIVERRAIPISRQGVARIPGADTDSASDWRQAAAPSLGNPNSASDLIGPAPLADPVHVRWVEPLPGAYSLVINAGVVNAGSPWFALISFLPQQGRDRCWGSVPTPSPTSSPPGTSPDSRECWTRAARIASTSRRAPFPPVSSSRRSTSWARSRACSCGLLSYRP